MTRDRVSSLKKSLHSYWNAIESPFEIIIHDHNSTFPPMVAYLKKLERIMNITVVHLEQGVWAHALEECRLFIQRYLELRPNILVYVFTDPDIAFLRTAPDVLLFYAGILQACPEYQVVGPALQISDIPSRFTHRAMHNRTVYELHSKFWTHVPNMATWNGIGYHVSSQPIDTTFAMRRRDTSLRRLTRPSLRVYAPYAAVHVDWYDDSEHLPDDKIYYRMRQSNVNHW